MIGSAIRGYAAEFGGMAAKGMGHIAPRLERIEVDETRPGLRSIKDRFVTVS
jgi:hypothetical protein